MTPAEHQAASGEAPGAPSAAGTQTIELPFVCVGCGYDLRGLSVEGKCPECGGDLRDSVPEDALAFSSMKYLQTLAAGLRLVFISSILTVLSPFPLLSIDPATLLPEPQRLIPLVLAAVLSVASLIGCWYYTAPDSALAAKPHESESTRRFLRAAATVLGVARLSVLAMFLTVGGTPFPVPGTWFVAGINFEAAGLPRDSAWEVVESAFVLIGWMAWIAGLTAHIEYTRLLAARVPDPWLTRMLGMDRPGRCFVLVPPAYWYAYLRLLGHVIAITRTGHASRARTN